MEDGILPNANDMIWTEGGPMSCSHWVGGELAAALRERGLWTDDRDPLEKLRDMALLSRVAIEAMHSWQEKAKAA
ncbi:hypothetical protein SH584_11580 [Sphingomonas sp. LY29]|uniref:hypothetical protein n=1 Tax=Sphingomonas sp. LY29 TaxID=3095341 RepID=UPI002D783761|nr:hypothetical protein [Sphingomonas sp. LY29]WRP25672.1 hypothetical protein SH584_11580 [Sphingomonas sp. LY29]